MKAKLLAASAIAALGVVCAAQAQDQGGAQPSVNIYGLVDATIRSVNHVNANGDRVAGFQTPWFSGNRLGFMGAEDLGGGLKALFKLESEFVLGTGAMDTANVFFSRDAWVGLESPTLGRVRLGRQNTVARDFAQVYGDAYGTAQLSQNEGGFSNTNNFKQLIYYSGSATGTRYDNGIVWKKVFDSGIVAGLGHQLGEVAGDTRRNTTDSIAVGYNGSNFVAASFYNRANVAGLDHQSWSLGGSYMFSIVRINAGYFGYTADQAAAIGQRKDHAWTVSTSITPGGAFDYQVGYAQFHVENGALNGAGTGILNPYADASKATAASSGTKGTLYGSVFYHLSKRTEVYVAADYMKLRDGFMVASAAGQKNQTELAVGFRTRF